MYTAACLCGGIQFELLAPLKEINVCHCKQCQRAQGAAFAAISQVQCQDLKMVQGEALLQEYYATPNKKRVFCRQCGSPIFSARLDKPDVVRFRVGLINETIDAPVVSHAYCDANPAWHVIGDDAPQYPDAKPQ